MEQSKIHPTWDVEHLLRSKSFLHLSEEEKERVLADISEEEYTQMRELILVSGPLLANTSPQLKPRIQTREVLSSEFHEHHQKAKVISFLKHPIPVWQVAAAAILLLASVKFINPDSFFQQEFESDRHQITDSTGIDTAIKVSNHAGEDSLFANMDSL